MENLRDKALRISTKIQNLAEDLRLDVVNGNYDDAWQELMDLHYEVFSLENCIEELADEEDF